VQARLTTRPRPRGSAPLGVALLAGVAFTLAACVAMPATVPDDPAIPVSASPAFTDLAPPPTTDGPTDPPVPTTEPGDHAFGETAVIHTDRGSTWEITATGSIDPADSLATLGCGGSGGAAAPRAGERFVVLDLEIENVGVITTHPMYDLTFGYQPDGGPVADQNHASIAAAPIDLGCTMEFAPGDRETAQVIVSIRDDAASTGTWIISPTDGTIDPSRSYRWR
jgi:hypothetical protein